MDNRDYLNQIAAQARPKAKSRGGKGGVGGGLMSSPIFKVIIGGVVALVLIIIMGAALGGGSASSQDKTVSLKLYMDSTLDVISDYQSSVKSSDLRSSSASLYSILSNTNRELTDYLTTKYDYKDNSVDKNLAEDEAARKAALEQDLFEAKINGLLDRIYAHKMAYEISMIMSKESSVYDDTSDENLQSLLSTSYNSLNNLYDDFSQFSETKQF